MKVYLSNYREHWFSPYTIAAKIYRTDDWDDPRVEKLVARLEPISVAIQKVLDFIHPRIKYIKIDKYDTWNMAETLGDIILPMLKQLKGTTHGAPMVDNHDVPMDLWNTDPASETGEVDANHFKRWDYVLDEMIWAFEQITDEDNDAQFHSGNSDYIRTVVEVEGVKMVKLEPGPNHTAEFDLEGYTAHHARIRNGTYLFGKYYRNLWD